ncbi:hypothetical protein CONLIGDRAFT_680968 [Coniochaeta ligniaria NRRL 30616]|uniref:Uncharacterized protein n=1 Tax=Coniochaeta ligniaria NRRL 30616 TaxID=1408157 RepID=A0A1J7ISP0_9PEZI|nr:hypothetical protein CONLIGDRAFT_680968 [Coniochaeta ligniaria NRRL 30616]
MKNNPDYKGKWTAPLIDNPAYKGDWAPRILQLQASEDVRTCLEVQLGKYDFMCCGLHKHGEGRHYINIVVAAMPRISLRRQKNVIRSAWALGEGKRKEPAPSMRVTRKGNLSNRLFGVTGKENLTNPEGKRKEPRRKTEATAREQNEKRSPEHWKRRAPYAHRNQGATPVKQGSVMQDPDSHGGANGTSNGTSHTITSVLDCWVYLGATELDHERTVQEQVCAPECTKLAARFEARLFARVSRAGAYESVNGLIDSFTNPPSKASKITQEEIRTRPQVTTTTTISTPVTISAAITTAKENNQSSSALDTDEGHISFDGRPWV